MYLKVELVSVRDNDGRGFLTYGDGRGGTSDAFTSLDDVQRRVPKLLRGVSSYWQVRVFLGDRHLYTGFRAGPGGTGERWKWSEV